MIPKPAEVSELAELAEALDKADHGRRVEWLRSVPMTQYYTLWDLAAGTSHDVSHYLAEDGGIRVHEGGNTAPPFRWFQKRFATYDDGTMGGYNHPGGLGQYVVWFQGYGPFTLRNSPEVEGEVWIDYTALPPQHPEFPPVRPIKFTRYLVYGGMIDVMRRVSRDVTIGSTEVKGFPIGIGAKFMLVREP